MTTIELPAPARTSRGRAFGLSGVLVAVMLLIAYIASNVSASLAQRSLQTRWEHVLASGVSSEPRAGDPVAQIAIPSIGLDAIVVEGPGGERKGPVHLPSTAPPGASGLSAIEGGRLGFGGFFARLDGVDVGDEIALETSSGVRIYMVIDVGIVDASAVDLTSNGDASILVLLAPASRLEGSERIVVRAREETTT